MVLLLLGLLLLASRFAFMMPWLIEHWLALAFSCHACVKLCGHVPVCLKEVPETWRTQRQHRVLSQPRILLDLSTTNTTRAAALQVLLLLHLLVCLLLLWSIYLLTSPLRIIQLLARNYQHYYSSVLLILTATTAIASYRYFYCYFQSCLQLSTCRVLPTTHYSLLIIRYLPFLTCCSIPGACH